jgi:ankyrin repeat protein
MVNDGNFDLVHPLHEACFHGNIECVQELLSAGATVNNFFTTMNLFNMSIYYSTNLQNIFFFFFSINLGMQ